MSASVVQIVTAAFALVAIVISLFALRIARRSPAAAEDNTAIAVREEQHRLAERHDAAGPTFELQPAYLHSNHTATIRLTITGGPTTMLIDATAGGVCWGIFAHEEPPQPVLSLRPPTRSSRPRPDPHPPHAPSGRLTETSPDTTTPVTPGATTARHPDRGVH